MRLRRYTGSKANKDKARLPPNFAIECKCTLDGLCKCYVVKKEDDARCDKCGWPFETKPDGVGCRPGNCSQRSK